MPTVPPQVIVLGGPNGVGKSTTAPNLLKNALAVDEFVNADTLAEGLSAFGPQRTAMQAGRIMLARLRELARQRVGFAFEATLAGRSFAPWIKGLIDRGYVFHLVYLWVSSPELAVARVVQRVQAGGHDVPRETIVRRYHAGLANFFRLYRPLAATWRFYDNSSSSGPILLATGQGEVGETVLDRNLWHQVLAGVHHDPYAEKGRH